MELPSSHSINWQKTVNPNLYHVSSYLRVTMQVLAWQRLQNQQDDGLGLGLGFNCLKWQKPSRRFDLRAFVRTVSKTAWLGPNVFNPI